MIPDQSALLILNMQDDLLSEMECSCSFLKTSETLIRGVQEFGLPVVVAAQEGCGSVNASILQSVQEPRSVHMKNSFSAMRDPTLRELILNLPVSQWLVIGLQTHISVLQTVRDLREAGKEVVVLNDCIASRSIYDYSTAIAEMRDLGVRISSTETILYEFLAQGKAPQQSAIAALTQ